MVRPEEGESFSRALIPLVFKGICVVKIMFIWSRYYCEFVSHYLLIGNK